MERGEPLLEPGHRVAGIKGHPNFGACADLGHWPKSGINPLDAVKNCRVIFLLVHLKDIAAFNDPSLKDVRVGTGVIDMPAVFAELKNSNSMETSLLKEFHRRAE